MKSYGIFYSDAELAFEIHARFVRKDHAVGKDAVALGRKIGVFVYVYAYAVTQRMGKILVQTVFFEVVAGDGVALAARHARGELFLYEHVRLQHMCICRFELTVPAVVAEQQRARAVRAVTADLTAEVDEHDVAEFELCIARFVMGHAGVGAECADG